MGQFLKKFGEAQTTSSSRGIETLIIHAKERVEVEEQDSVHFMPQENTTIYIKPSMLRMDEILGKTPIKDLDHIQLVLTWMPSRSLYKLQVSVDHEMQSWAHEKLVELQKEKKQWEVLEKEYEQEK